MLFVRGDGVILVRSIALLCGPVHPVLTARSGVTRLTAMMNARVPRNGSTETPRIPISIHCQYSFRQDRLSPLVVVSFFWFLCLVVSLLASQTRHTPLTDRQTVGRIPVGTSHGALIAPAYARLRLIVGLQ